MMPHSYPLLSFAHSFVIKIKNSSNMTTYHEKGSHFHLEHHGNTLDNGPISQRETIPFTWTHYLPKTGIFYYLGDISGTFIHRGPQIVFIIKSSLAAFGSWPVHITV